MVTLRVISGPLAGEEIEVERELVIGRQGADVVIDDPELSRRHVHIRPHGDILIVEDLLSTNGTLVDDLAIEGPVHVSGGARMTLGMTVIEVVAPLPATAPADGRGEPTRLHESSQRTAVAESPARPVDDPSTPPREQGRSAEPAPAPQQLGVFTPPRAGRARGLASRSWVPVALSFGSAISTAIALVIYFAQR
jgi:hypothetical protein